LRRSSRQVQHSTRLRNFITYSVHYPIQDYIFYNHISNEHYAFLSSLSRIEEPINYEIAKLKPKWCKAMNEELNALERNQTWKVCYLPKNKNRLDVNGYTKLNIIATVSWNGIKLD
jgi:hypothetical protein